MTAKVKAEKKEQQRKTFDDVCNIDCEQYLEKKGKLIYLSWANAWREFKKVYPNALYNVIKNPNNLPYFFDETTGYMVYTEVTVDGLTHEMWLPVMDFRNKAITKATMVDINKTIMRCLTKNLAMFGLGLYIYAGEDLPEESDALVQNKQPIKKTPPAKKPATKQAVKKLSREKQDEAHAKALRQLASCATLERLKTTFAKIYGVKDRIDADLWADIEQKKDECKEDIIREGKAV